MISPQTGFALATAGIGTLVAGAMVGSEPQEKPAWGEGPSNVRMAALAPGLGGLFAGVMLSLTAPGRSLAPVYGALGAATGGMLIGQHVFGPLLRGVRGN